MTSLDFTVAIPTFNGASRVPLVLERLRSQLNTESIQWEILVIDNNSNDTTAQVIQTYQAEWTHPFDLKYYFEPEQGAAFARQKAVQMAQGEWIGFLDDDNLPDPDWVRAAYAFGKQHPQAGAYGSKIVGEFEVSPPQELKPLLFYLALVDRGPHPIQYQPKQNGVPPSAGVVVRRDAWLNHVPARLFLVGRVGQSMLPGEDLEALTYIYLAGFEIWYNPEMQIQHLIPARRFEPTYFLKLMRGTGLYRHHIRMLMLQGWQRPFAFGLYLINDLRKLVAHVLRHSPQFKTNLTAAAELERLLGTCLSPFYLWGLRIHRVFHRSSQP